MLVNAFRSVACHKVLVVLRYTVTRCIIGKRSICNDAVVEAGYDYPCSFQIYLIVLKVVDAHGGCLTGKCRRELRSRIPLGCNRLCIITQKPTLYHLYNFRTDELTSDTAFFSFVTRPSTYSNIVQRNLVSVLDIAHMTSAMSSSDPASEKSPADNTLGMTVANSTQEEKKYVTGFRLVLLLGSLTLVTFLVLLDMSIIGTVCVLTTLVWLYDD